VHRAEWIFDDIKADSFHWRAVTSHDGGKTWQMQSEMFAKRMKTEAKNEKQPEGTLTTTDKAEEGKEVRDEMKSTPGTGSGATLSREEQNSRTILEVFRAIEERNQEQFVKHIQPDFEIHWPTSLPYGGTFRGLEPRPNGWNEIWEPLQPTPAEKRMDAHVIAARGDEVVVLWHQRGRTPSGERFDQEVVGMYRFREGKLARAQMFYFDTAAVARFLAQAQASTTHER
jgi:ketosteroid isomerase-like protein